ncbi:MAG: hypothetical protein ABL901_04135, partial [Hyphomicrobiaceae bacterium]
NAAHPNAKTYRLHDLGRDPQTTTSPEKFGIAVLLTVLAAMLASALIARKSLGLPFPGLPFPGLPFPGLPFPGLPFPGLPFPGLAFPSLAFPSLAFPGLPFPSGPTALTRVSPLKIFATALAGTATLLLAATGTVLAISPAVHLADLAVSAHLALTLLFASALVLMLASRVWEKLCQRAPSAVVEHPIPFRLAALATAALAISGLMLALPLVFTGPQGQTAAATLHLLSGAGLTALVSGWLLSRLIQRLAAWPRSMPKTVRLAPRSAN